MFTDFFYILKKRKVPVSITEWMTLMEALSKGLISNLDDFYVLARAILVKNEVFFDDYDLAFQEFFTGLEMPVDLDDKFMKWLSDGKKLEEIMTHPGEFDMWELEEMMREFEKRMAEQNEQHDGGGYWIGRGGTSPFGHSGTHPAGIRIGGQSKGRGAIQIAHERHFKNYRHDLTLDVRQIKVALKPLRKLNRIGPEDELDLDGTIDATAKNAGDIEMRWMRSRRNAVKVLLLMDSGGSMEPFADVCNQLFSAAHSSAHFKDFKYYYFHNCIYENVYEDMEGQVLVSTDSLLHNLDKDYKVVFVGDARMAMSELTARYGAIYYYHRNEIPGIVWLKKLADHFTHCIWLNPEGERYWNHPTVQMIGQIFPMYEMTLDGLNDGVRKLIKKK